MTGSASVASRCALLEACSSGVGALETSDRGGQDKSRKVRTVGLVRNSAKFQNYGKHCECLS
jgi:hypothetical protein